VVLLCSGFSVALCCEQDREQTLAQLKALIGPKEEAEAADSVRLGPGGLGDRA